LNKQVPPRPAAAADALARAAEPQTVRRAATTFESTPVEEGPEESSFVENGFGDERLYLSEASDIFSRNVTIERRIRMRPMIRACLVLGFCLGFSVAVLGAEKAEATAQAKAYRAVLKAISAGDLEAYKKGLSSASLKQMEDQTKGKSSKEVMGFVKMMSPTDQTISSVKVDGKNATLKVSGKMDGQAMNGSIPMVEEGGQWKVGQPSWEPAKK